MEESYRRTQKKNQEINFIFDIYKSSVFFSSFLSIGFQTVSIVYASESM